MVEFIVPTFDREKQLMSMLGSLVAQINEEWIATVVVDDVENDRIKRIVDKFECEKIRYIFTGRRYNDWGHTPRNIGKNQSEADYIIMTGDDNYYVPSLTFEINKLLSHRYGMIYWDMITNNWANYTWFNTRVSDGFIDMGCFATRNDIAKQINLEPTCFAADHAFVLEFNRRFPHETAIKIPKILFVHN